MATLPKALRTLDCRPQEMALRLHHLPGFVWLDTAGHHQENRASISMLAARPRRQFSGQLENAEDLANLRKALETHRHAGREFAGPTGGLIGSVDYDGRFQFGEYHDLLIYQHKTGEWWEMGDLISQASVAGKKDEAAKLQFQPQMQEEEFQSLVARAQRYISAGDIYQVNLSYPYRADWPVGADPLATYLRLRTLSPAPYAAYLQQPGRTILSSSPESFLRMNGVQLQTRPIKGTRPRGRDAAEDARSRESLLRSSKERAELLMITDLERNDLGRISAYGSVQVPQLLELETHAHVFHLVSTVCGTLREGLDHLDVLSACCPGGSITGAPKHRARQIIAELESAPRGLYTGAIGYLGFNGQSQFNIAIRTIVHEKGVAHFHVGAGIVADSKPQSEWEETRHKAAGMLAAGR